jgi:hypothetical protein
MKSEQSVSASKALVTVFDNLETAKNVVEELHSAGFSLDKIELVTHSVHDEAPELTTPRIHETTASSMVDSATKWSGVGAATGLLAAVFAPFPGLGLAMIFMGGLAGAVVGGIAGLDHAIEDDSVDLPTLDEYEQLVETGDSLVVVLGNHEEAMRAEAIVKNMYDVRSHIHVMHGHQYHEHPTRQ